jgi:MerR family copper efflux transcriptional regulator
MRSLTIGQFAKEAGIGVETVRYYQRRGLIREPERSNSAYRRYGLEDLDRLRFIRKAQAAGFTLSEIRELLELRDDPDATRGDVRSRSAAKIAEIDQKIRDLQEMREALARLIESCEGEGNAKSCPILTSFT